MAITYQIRGQNLGDVIASKQATLLTALIEKMSGLMFQLQEKMRTMAPVGEGDPLHPAGTLRESIRNPQASLEGDQIVGTVDFGGEPTTVKTYEGKAYDYARIVTEGSSEHLVPVSEGKKALHFLVGGKDVFAKWANVGGVTANPFHIDALLEMRDQIISELQETVNGALS